MGVPPGSDLFDDVVKVGVELMTNSVCHAQCSRDVLISLTIEGYVLTIEAEDGDPRPLCTDDVPAWHGLGRMSAVARAHSGDLRAVVDAEAGAKTVRVRLCVPGFL
ncbi:hypothetical protein [Streptomyces longispororuber]|uniref:hypothetical protein n=1 Tax=Streptomyces longispororuber TaxID=68230 RepID=UPI00210A0A7E|nr:hypothetical protein [Streptomyces longispororuber]MCQ4211507.1 hypothetical protein [Streptomyces longispororuber]